MPSSEMGCQSQLDRYPQQSYPKPKFLQPNLILKSHQTLMQCHPLLKSHQYHPLLKGYQTLLPRQRWKGVNFLLAGSRQCRRQCGTQTLMKADALMVWPQRMKRGWHIKGLYGMQGTKREGTVFPQPSRIAPKLWSLFQTKRLRLPPETCHLI